MYDAVTHHVLVLSSGVLSTFLIMWNDPDTYNSDAGYFDTSVLTCIGHRFWFHTENCSKPFPEISTQAVHKYHSYDSVIFMKKAACGGMRLYSHSLNLWLSVHPYLFLFFFFLFSHLSLSLSCSIFPYYWVLITAVIGNSLLCMCTHKHTHTHMLCLAAANPSGNVYAYVCCGGRRERYGEIRIMKEGEFQNYRPTHQLNNLSAVWTWS